MTASRPQQELILSAIREWMLKLQEYPGWQEWKRSHIGYTIFGDDELIPDEEFSTEFKFSSNMEKEHAVVTCYMELLSTVNALRDVEWYFRRYPFSRAPVSRESHLKYCCEMYFGRFYQFRERLKKLSKVVTAAAPDHGLNFGKFIKNFDKEFDQEIRARHSVHHHEAFDEVAINRIALLEFAREVDENELRKREIQYHYRKTAKSWASRSRQKSQCLDKYVEAVAKALLECCSFLVVPNI